MSRPLVPTLRVALLALALASPALAEPGATVVALPFAVSELRAPGSEAAIAVATASEARDAGVARDTTLAVAWGTGGGAALLLADGAVRALALPPSVIEGARLAETPRGAPAGSRGVRAGPLAAHLTPAAVTITERQPMRPSAEPKPVPTTTARVEAGPGAAFSGDLRLAELDGRPVLLAVKAYEGRGEALALLGRERDGEAWRILAETPAGAPGERVEPAAFADFSGRGQPILALVRSSEGRGTLQVWRYEAGRLALAHALEGYAAGRAAAVDLDGDGVPELALPTLDRSGLALLSLRDAPRERARLSLPAPARPGVAALGTGRGAHLLVALADGRVAAVRAPDRLP